MSESEGGNGYEGNALVGVAVTVVLGPLALIGIAGVVIGFLALWGIEIGPWTDRDYPVLLDWLYGTGRGAFRSFVFFMGGAMLTMFSWTGIVWAFTGNTPAP